MIRTFVLSLSCVAFNLPAFSHGDIHERIVKTTKEISKKPDSAFLYVKRGKLYFQHEDYNESISDLDTSIHLGYYSVDQQLMFAKVYQRLEEHTKALQYIETILNQVPQSAVALRIKGQLYFELRKYEEAALIFEILLENAEETFPENYLEASIAWEQLHTDVGYNKAVKVVEHGIESLGNIISLYDRLIELAISQEDYDMAINVQRKVIDFSPRKEFCYYKLAEFQFENSLKEEALTSLLEAKTAFYKLPKRIQNTAHMKELIHNIKLKETEYITN